MNEPSPEAKQAAEKAGAQSELAERWFCTGYDTATAKLREAIQLAGDLILVGNTARALVILQDSKQLAHQQPSAPTAEWHHKLADFVNLILHGDDEHKAWLREAGEAFITGKPVPEPRQKTCACAYCHKGARELERGYLIRVNKLGDTPAIWLCTDHFNFTDWKAAR